MNIKIFYNKYFINSTGVSIDTRNLNENQIYIALKGKNFDGNKFVHKAIEKNVLVSVIDNEKYFIKDKTILVNNCLEFIQELSNFHRKQFDIPVFAITGTNGKTTTKELLNSVLSTKFNVTSTQGNFNNHIGVPLTLLNINNKTDFAIIEMGANHINEINFLCKIAEPTHGLIISIGKAHIEGFGSVENIKIAKKELFDYIKSKELIFFSNQDDEIVKSFSTDYSNSIKFGAKSNNISKIISAFPTLAISYLFNGVETEIKTNLFGEYNYGNLLATVKIGKFFEIPGVSIVEALENYYPINNRSQVLKTKHNTLVVDAYNANPTSMLGAINSFNNFKVEGKILIIGEMAELGDISSIEHNNLITHISKLKYEKIYVVGDEFKEMDLGEIFTYFSNTDLLCKFLEKNRINNKYILIKGSRRNRLDEIIEYL